MHDPAVFDDLAISVENKNINTKIKAIDQLMDEIDLQYDYRASVDLKDIERIQNDNKVNDSHNLQPKF